jgi:putative DNA primase/helicase
MSEGTVHDSSEPVACLQRLLGPDVVLLWVPKGEKSPKFKGWQNVTVESMRKPRYVANLNSGHNIAVLLGTPSCGICSIDIDHDSDVGPFLELNPDLRNSLRSKGRRGCNIWVRIEGGYPAPAALKKSGGAAWGEWRATGNVTVIHGLHPQGMQYHIEHEVPPAAIRFEEIVWPSELRLPWIPDKGDEQDSLDAGLRLKYGEPVFFGSRNDELYVKEVNQAYWGGLYAAENIALFEPDEQIFYRYSPETGLYAPESADVIKQSISARMLKMSREVQDVASLETFRDNGTLNAIVAHLRGIIERRGAFASRQRIVHLSNGVLRFDDEGAEFLPFSPLFLSRNRSPIPFDPDATCPRFLNELVRPAVHAEDVILLQKMAGLSLLGVNIIQKLLILDGLPGRGKSAYANVLQGLVGIPNVTQLRTQHLHERFELFKYLRRTLLVGVDVDADFLSSKGASVIKGLVGGDWFDAEQKGGTGSFQFQGKFNILMTSNARLRVRLQGDVGAWRRRLLIVRYEADKPPKEIGDFPDMLLREEGSGILNWALEGLALLFEDIAATGNIRLTDRQRGMVDSLLAESDSLRHFLGSRVLSAPGSDLTSDEIVRAYAHYCPEMGWEALAETVIARQLPSLMLELFRTTKSHDIQREGRNRRGFRDVAFKPQED